MGLEISERTSAISIGLVVCCTGLNSKDIYIVQRKTAQLPSLYNFEILARSLVALGVFRCYEMTLGMLLRLLRGRLHSRSSFATTQLSRHVPPLCMTSYVAQHDIQRLTINILVRKMVC